MSTKQRIEKLEKKASPSEPVIIAIDWGDYVTLSNGQRMTPAEFAKLYPDAEVITWDDSLPD